MIWVVARGDGVDPVVLNLSCHVTFTARCAIDWVLSSRAGCAVTPINVTRGSHNVIASLTSRTIDGIAELIGLSMYCQISAPNVGRSGSLPFGVVEYYPNALAYVGDALDHLAYLRSGKAGRIECQSTNRPK